MAEKRMFSRKIVGSDAFLSLPASAQALYFQLNMAADDDGFVNGGAQVVRSAGAKPKDLKLLVEKRFVLQFQEAGILVIKHWRMHNSLKNDRAKLPLYPSLASRIWIKNNNAYTDHGVPDGKTLMDYKTEYIQSKTESKRNPSGIQTESQRKREEIRGKEIEQEEERGDKRNPQGGGGGSLQRMFDAFWEAYPKHAGIQETMEAWERLNPDQETFDRIMLGLQEWKKDYRWLEEGGWFVPKAEKFLTERQWLSKAGESSGGWRLGTAELEAIQAILRPKRGLEEDESLAVRRMMEDNGEGGM